jgi:RNA polymerase sigma factor (sigma-70 family)
MSITEERRPQRPGPNGHVCNARDQMTVLFCNGTRHGDQAALDEFMAFALPWVIRTVAPRLTQWQLSQGFAEVVACESLVKALRKADQFDCHRRSVIRWVYGIVAKEIVNCIRAQKAFDHLSLDRDGTGTDEAGCGLYRFVANHKAPQPPDELIFLDNQARREKQLAALNAAILDLPYIERQVVIRRLADVPNRVIASELGITCTRVAAIFYIAKERLRRWIG